jgi:hypothetical protein
VFTSNELHNSASSLSGYPRLGRGRLFSSGKVLNVATTAFELVILAKEILEMQPGDQSSAGGAAIDRGIDNRHEPPKRAIQLPCRDWQTGE